MIMEKKNEGLEFTESINPDGLGSQQEQPSEAPVFYFIFNWALRCQSIFY